MCRMNDSLCLKKSQQKIALAVPRRTKKSITLARFCSTQLPTRSDSHEHKQTVQSALVVTAPPRHPSVTANSGPSPQAPNCCVSAVSKLLSGVKNEIESDREQARDMRVLRSGVDQLKALTRANNERLHNLQMIRAQQALWQQFVVGCCRSTNRAMGMSTVASAPER